MYGNSSKYPDSSDLDRSTVSAFRMASSDAIVINRSGAPTPKNQCSASAKEAPTGSTLAATPTTHIETMAQAAISVSGRTTSGESSSQRGNKSDARRAEQCSLPSDLDKTATAFRIGVP